MNDKYAINLVYAKELL